MVPGLFSRLKYAIKGEQAIEMKEFAALKTEVGYINQLMKEVPREIKVLGMKFVQEKGIETELQYIWRESVYLMQEMERIQNITAAQKKASIYGQVQVQKLAKQLQYTEADFRKKSLELYYRLAALNTKLKNTVKEDKTTERFDERFVKVITVLSHRLSDILKFAKREGMITQKDVKAKVTM